MVAGGASARKLHLCKICTTAAQQERRSSQGACGAVRRERRAAGGRRIVPLKPRQALAASAASAGGAPGSCATVFDSRRDDAGGQHALDMRRGQAQQQQLALARPWQSVAEIPDFQVGNRGTNRFCARAERASAAEVLASLHAAGRAFRRARTTACVSATACDIVAALGASPWPRARGAPRASSQELRRAGARQQAFWTVVPITGALGWRRISAPS